MSQLVVIGTSGRERLIFDGPDLDWDVTPDEKSWLGFTRLSLVLADGTSILAFDADAAAGSDVTVPSSGAHKLVRESRLRIFKKGLLKPVDEQTRRLPNGTHLWASFFWRNPLTPHGAGLWMDLQFWQSSRNPIRLCRGKDPDPATNPGTRLWHADRTTPLEWDESSDLAARDNTLNTDYLTFDTFAAHAFDYVKVDDAAPLLGNDPDRWIADARDRDCVFSISGREQATGAPSEQVLPASVRLARDRPIAANSNVLGGSGAPLAASQLSADRLNLQCVRRTHRSTRNDAWIVDWPIESAIIAARPAALTLPVVWRLIASHYNLGLAAARSRNRFSSVPTRIVGKDLAGAPSGPATLRFEIATGPDRALLDVRLGQVSIGTNVGLELTLGGAQQADGSAPLLSVSASDIGFKSQQSAAADGTPSADSLLALLATPAGPAPSADALAIDWILGGGRARARLLDNAKLRFTIEPRGELLERQPLGCSVRYAFTEGRLTPVSQDPEPGFETASAWLDRPRPIAIDLSDSVARPLSLVVEETASHRSSRLLRIEARNAASSAGAQFDSDVVVIDPAPLTIARVWDVLTLEKDDLVAEYIDDSEAAPSWEFTAKTGEMTIILPPQAIGEEMIKGRLALEESPGVEVEIPFKDRPFDYRLGANAALFVDRTDVDTARTAPPWMLRRHLNRRTGTTGLKLKAASFELVYGLTTNIGTKGLRIAELDALVGRIPLADRLVGLLRDQRASRTEIAAKSALNIIEELQRRYAENQGRWILDLLSRPSWWPLFRDVADRRQLKLSDDVEVEVRPQRQTANPFRVLEYADPAGEAVGGTRRPLRGGVDWLFQSPTIYEEFKDRPVSVEALVEGIAFGPLGGEGNQTAHFSNGKTIVISRTRQGMLESLVLMRIGRIGMLWNSARHVIVYQRSSRRAPRYGYYDSTGAPIRDPAYSGDTFDKQRIDHDGYMALRKVREYVEITQPRRAYPDLGGGLQRAGPLVQSTFETTVIPVKSAWGRDVDHGQLIPLFGPLDPGEERFFPRPRIFLEMARALEKGGGAVASEVADPSQLFFFTSTRPQDGRDTDRWPAWPDLDYPLIDPPPPPKVDFKPNFAGARKQPDAARAGMGQDRFTIDLNPNQEGVNLLHGRQVNALEARVMNVSLARGRPDLDLPPNALQRQLGGEFAGANAILHDRLSELRSYAASLSQRDATLGSAELAQFKSDAGTMVAEIGIMLRSLKGKLETEIHNPQGNRFAITGNWDQRQQAVSDAFKQNVTSELSAVAGEFAKLWRDIEKLSPEEQRTRAIATYQGAVAQVRQRISTVSFVPGEAADRLRRTVAQVEVKAVEAFAAASGRLFASFANVRQRYETNPVEAGALDAEWRLAVGDSIAALGKFPIEALAIIDASLGSVFGVDMPIPAGKAMQPRLVEEVRKGLEWYLLELQLRADEIPPLDLGPNWSALDEVAEVLTKLSAGTPDINGWLRTLYSSALQEFEEKAAAATTAISEQIELQREKIAAESEKILIALLDGAANLEAIFKDVEVQFVDWSTSLATDIIAELEVATKGLKDWAGNFDAVGGFAGKVDTIVGEIEEALGKGDLAEMMNALEASSRELGDEFRRAARHATHSIVEDLRGSAGDLLAMGAPSVLELGRALASGIENDTLRCTRDALGYYFSEADKLTVTRASTIFNELGNGNLNALSAMVPFESIRERILPELAGLDFSSIFPDFAGLKLEYLFPELRIAKDKLGQYEWLTIKEGFDKDRLTAWSDITIDKTFDEAPTLFAIPPLSLTLGNARLKAHCHIDIGGGERRQDISGSILADWALNLSGRPIVTFKRADLTFGNDGKFDFRFESENIELAQELKFLTDALKQMLPQEEGLTITPALPAGIKAELSLPLPDIGTGAFTITGVTLFAHLGLSVDTAFKVTTGFWLSKPDRPFGLAVLFLGGGGWVGVDVSYQPPAIFETRVSIGVSAGAFVALNLGFARASAGLLFTAGIDFYARSGGRGGSRTAVSLGLLIWGDFSILSIVHAYLRITASITYSSDGGMVARGRVEVKIRISFFYTLRVSRSFERVFSGGGGKALSTSRAAMLMPLAVNPVRHAIDCHFQTLDLP